MLEIPIQDPATVAAAPSDRLTASQPALAAMPNLTLIGYPVSGRSRRAVREEMNERRPETGGQRHDARTTWRYSYKVGGREGVCRPETAEVTVAITVIMPDLEAPERLGRQDRAAWDRYIAALAFHEGNHARIANLGAERMQQSMRAAASCDALRQLIEAESDQVAAASRQYDLQTRHGATEGAQF